MHVSFLNQYSLQLVYDLMMVGRSVVSARLQLPLQPLEHVPELDGDQALNEQAVFLVLLNDELGRLRIGHRNGLPPGELLLDVLQLPQLLMDELHLLVPLLLLSLPLLGRADGVDLASYFHDLMMFHFFAIEI